ncbi:hypothetical protein AAHN93_14470 [Vandammella animalimorsus]|uniref:hypothetical protein n=1 Tax=Vandammella animalimorsus TaxID=2029117 RepID=UPI0031BACC9E
MGIEIKLKNGKELDVIYLVLQSSKFAAKIVPPYDVLRRFFFSGKSKYSYHGDVTWEPFVLSRDDYNSIVGDLSEVYGFSGCSDDLNDVDDLEWYVMSVAKSYGLSVHVVRDLAEKMYWVEFMLGCIDSISKGAIDNDFLKISELLQLKRVDVFNDLECLT